MSSLKTLSRQKFKDYLSSSKLEESFDFFQDGTIKLHWSNDKRLNEYFRGRASAENKLLRLCEERIEKLKNHFLWLRNRRSLVRSSLYDLYHAYSDPLLRQVLFKQEGEDQVSYSTQTKAGPFASLCSLGWFDGDIYRDFIYCKLLKGQASERDFRLSVNLPLHFCRIQRPLEKIPMKLTQVSRRGLLFELPSEYRWSHEKGLVKEEIQLFFPRGFTYKNSSPDNLKHLSLCLKQFSHNQESQSEIFADVEFSILSLLQKNFLYLSYDSFKGESAKDFIAFFNNLISSSEETMGELLLNAA